MITADAILKKDFTRGVRGYKEEEVDQFLDIVAAGVDSLHRENAALKEKIKELVKEGERYRAAETTVLGTLEAARALMTDISASSEKRAEIVLKNAELDAERIRREARDSVEHMTEEAIALSRRWELFGSRFRNLLETELDRFDSFSASMLLDEPLPAMPGPAGRGAAATSKPADSPLAGVNPNKTFISKRQV